MIPLKEVKKSKYNSRYAYRNYASELCHHLKLGTVLKELTNLTSLSLEYGLRRCQYTYKKRFFEISYEDIEDLAKYEHNSVPLILQFYVEIPLKYQFYIVAELLH